MTITGLLCIGLGAGRRSISLSIAIGIVLGWGCMTDWSCRNKVTVLIGVSEVVARGYCVDTGLMSCLLLSVTRDNNIENY